VAIMLNRVKVQNFKCLRDVDVELGPFTVLIGPNDSGKSSFLAALQLLGKLAFLDHEHSQAALDVAKVLRQNSWRLSAEATVLISAEGNEPDDFALLFSVGTNSAQQIQSLRVGENSPTQTLPILPKKFGMVNLPQSDFRGNRFEPNHDEALLPQLIEAAVNGRQSTSTGDPNGSDLRQIQNSLHVSEPFRFSPAEMRKPAKAEAVPVLSSRGENLAAVVNALLTSPDRETVTELERSLHEAIPSLRRLSTPADANNGSLRVIKFTLSGNEKPPLTIPAEQVSDGAMFLIAFLVLVHSHPAQVLLIEEPENGLHPSRLQSVIELLRKLTTGELGHPPRQIILTTHSPVLLNCVTPDEVRIFRRDDEGATQVVRMDELPDIDRLSKEFAPGELWYLFGEEELVKGPAP
jgi:predicted ATPase